MKSNTLERETYFSGSGQSQAMSIQSSAKIVGILVDSMYSDKPKAIYREMVSNGWDSQREAGTSHIPPDVTMPSLFTPKFSYRDYGTGLSHEFMMNGYCMIGHSTKEDTNEAVGKWGLGRLVPLSYTDTYSVVSYQGGYKRSYSIVRSDNGIECVPMGEEPTTEANGLEVSFPIRKEDTKTFQQALEYVCLGLDVKPRVLGMKDYEWPQVPVSMQGNGWTYLDKSKLPYGHPLKDRAHVRMGCVLYPVATTTQGYNESVILEAPIGSLAVTASRESLSYGKNEPTQDTINTLMQKFLDEVVEHSIQKVRDSKTYLEAYNNYIEARQSLRGVFRDKFTLAVTMWNGYLLNEYLPISDGGDFQRWSEYSYDLVRRVQVTKSGSHHSRYSSVSKDNFAFVVENVTEGSRDVRGPKRILNWWKNMPADKRYDYLAWFQFDQNDKKSVDLLTYLVTMYPEINFHQVSTDCPDIPPAKKGSRPVEVKTLLSTARDLTPQYWRDYKLSSEDFDNGGFYVESVSNEVEWSVRSYYGLALALKEIDFQIYVVPKTLWKKFEAASQWKKADKEFIKRVNKHRVGLVASAKTYSSRNILTYLKPYEHCDTLIASYFKAVQGVDYQTNSTSFNPAWCENTLKKMGVDTSSFNRGPYIDQLLNKIEEKYPLLKMAHHSSDTKLFEDYIKQMQKLEEKAYEQV